MLDFINQNNPIKFFIAFAIVLVLIALTAWLVRRFGANRLTGGARGRQPRLAVIDAASVDGRRRLVLIRRDNVEHLMMIGGPNDLIVEPNIVRAATARDMGRETLRSTTPEARPLPDGNGNWATLQPTVEPTPPPLQQPMPPLAPVQAPPPRSYRLPVTDEPWVPPEPPAREPALRARPTDSLTGMAAEFSAKLSPEIEPRPAPTREPAAATPPPSTSPPQTDRNLAEMAQRLEAALRRPASPDSHAPVTDPLAAAMAPARQPEPPRAAKPEPKPEFKPEPKIETKSAQAKNPFDSLEEEMASLLGRQSGKT